MAIWLSCPIMKDIFMHPKSPKTCMAHPAYPHSLKGIESESSNAGTTNTYNFYCLQHVMLTINDA